MIRKNFKSDQVRTCLGKELPYARLGSLLENVYVRSDDLASRWKHVCVLYLLPVAQHFGITTYSQDQSNSSGHYNDYKLW